MGILHRSLAERSGIVLVGAVCLLVGCSRPQTELSLKTYAEHQDQQKIADFYAQEAIRSRQMAQDLFRRVKVYERLFGPDSDWVAGTRVLAESYEEAAHEDERAAARHLAAAQGAGGGGEVRSDPH